MKLPKNYEPKEYEESIYALWEEKGAFKPKHRGNKESFSVVIPPPNANADLHIGTGMTLAIEDIAIRYQRMLGKSVMLVPGADHAGFETQSVYEKQLAKEGKSRFDFSREDLYKQIWDFVALNRSKFEIQMRALGASPDWDHFTYTLDQKVVDRAYATFKQMWDDKLVYRGERLVNYCTFHGTGFADVEVEYKEQNGYIWSIRYPLSDSSGEVVVATTRPETMLGDVAVAVHPEDARYQHLIGKTIKLPLTHREIPILADEFVERDFGTGAVKITPAHDINDYEVAGRHDLPMISIIDGEGKLNHNAPERYQGLSVNEAREVILEDLEGLGALIETKEHVNNVGHCYKCGTVIEPLLKEQWFVDMKPLAKKAIEVLREGKITFYPSSKKDQLIRYLEGLRDWNISRQIAWGIPIPAFQNIDDPDDWIFNTNVDQKVIELEGKTYHRDPDVFDTWFSSSSWPYATLDFPDSNDFKQFYPLSLMETGGEILYPWVSRMIMLGLYVTGEIPFKDVYIHGYVMAEDGSKMSKSIGNVVNPMPIIEKYGSDALRMGIIAGRSPAVNRGYDPRRVEEARNFCNKMWNIARFIEGVLEDKLEFNAKPHPESLPDHWVIHQISTVGAEIGRHLDEYRFSEGYEALYHLIWDDLADWYIEASKGAANASVLSWTLQATLKLAHPFAPFVTEAIWQSLYESADELLITSSWPEEEKSNEDSASAFEDIKQIVTEVRHIKTMLKIKGGELLFNSDKFIDKHSELITKLARLEKVTPNDKMSGIQLTQSTHECWLNIEPEVAKTFVTSLEIQLIDSENQLSSLKKRLGNKSYVEKAPAHLVKATQDQISQIEAELETINSQLERFKSI